MVRMYRIALSRLLFFVRLAIVVSLAGYNVSNVNAAMHGPASQIEKTASGIAAHAEHDLAGVSDHQHSHGDRADGAGPSKIVKQECCNDFCGGFVLLCTGQVMGGPVVSSIRQFVNDQAMLGELPPLHRPPNI
ncbi:hypothetical protein [Rhizobium bangladeshense]|uniref:hypothetical protein n=1 Tax=Rhizobium bangladeshense TaxID=1138189 RepID=UPI001C83042D|nr:hypothetical protein [Rhizobium bangladeshense]MBX4868541.1 hypothetical protein [Rhizobium bangladeshense]MBX4890095.1 hypothetical protein [Rhizobium bangladeshense]MBX4920255.1 hypothetical protein [Rhizobium bangladeshense]